jgi:hypothetical protein
MSKFNPLTRIEDAFGLLKHARATFELKGGAEKFTAKVRIGRANGSASGAEIPRVLSSALAKAIGLEIDSISRGGADGF